MPYIIHNLKTDYRVLGISKGTKYNPGDLVSYLSDVGLEVGRIKLEAMSDFKEVQILRLATEQDLALMEKSKIEDKICLDFVKYHIKKLNLEMKILNVIFSIDLKNLLILFEAPKKVDFRELLKILLTRFKTRIELRQILSKDLAKLLGGIGQCGRVLCCKQLGRVCNATAKMARNQNLPQSTNINGMCGRPMCCLQYEDDFYTHQRERLPKQNDYILIESDKYLVLSINHLSEVIRLQHVEDTSFLEVDLKKVKYKVIN